ncbi:hypothetical protein KAI87_11140 [Myxococcota bacterium]|nr:hypothetical protein [Myxococcota bacterium]
MAKVNEAKLDKRLIERNLKRGIVKKGDVDKYLDGLEDLAEDADFTSLDELTNPRKPVPGAPAA